MDALFLRATGARLPRDGARSLGMGGEAEVFAVPGAADSAAKVYHRPTDAHAAKLDAMLANPPAMPEGAGFALAWPTDVLLDDKGRVRGFVMPRVEGRRLFELYNPASRLAAAPLFDWGRLHRAARRAAQALDALHAAGHVAGDVNESNFVVHPEDATLVLVDADSVQVRDPAGAVFRSPVGKPEFTPPELQGTSFATVDRTPAHDRFGLAVLVYQALMEGTHPFAAFYPQGEPPPVEARIRAGAFPHGERGAALFPPRLAPSFTVLHPALRRLFLGAFVEGHADPEARPTAAEWAAALETAEAELVVCLRNPQHRHAMHLGACPWCERTSLLRGRDPFPATAADAGRIVREDGGALARAGLPGYAPPPGLAAPAPVPPFAPRPAPAPAAAPATPAVPAVPPAAFPLPQWMHRTHPMLWVAAGLAGATLLPPILAVFAGAGAAGIALQLAQARGHLRQMSPWGVAVGVMVLVVMLLGARGDSDDDDFSVPEPYPPTEETDITVGAPLDLREPVVEINPPQNTDPQGDEPVLLNEAGARATLVRELEPRLASVGDETGSAAVTFRVLADGTVDPGSIRILNGTSEALSEATIATVRTMFFQPLGPGETSMTVFLSTLFDRS